MKEEELEELLEVYRMYVQSEGELITSHLYFDRIMKGSPRWLDFQAHIRITEHFFRIEPHHRIRLESLLEIQDQDELMREIEYLTSLDPELDLEAFLKELTEEAEQDYYTLRESDESGYPEVFEDLRGMPPLDEDFGGGTLRDLELSGGDYP